MKTAPTSGQSTLVIQHLSDKYIVYFCMRGSSAISADDASTDRPLFGGGGKCYEIDTAI